MIPHMMARHLITSAVVDTEDDDDALVYVKRYQKREWLKDVLENDARDNIIIETLDADYEDIESLNNLDVILCDVINTLRIVHYKMYLKYLTGGHNARKKFVKIKYVNINMFHLFSCT